ncbi:TRPM8 channel-associated factor 2 isoform X2 [Mesoplodon densirostris]|uniref:TRPM8 channel-associated factor 2 isoform X2 n=1 Tax=Mesoplodon densirostris TaxID=48708 RepID=UPI0028DB47C8|nr:TRPM8 channel-associated factor 2 isoform X2 [Mesoplodon densirostris]
MATTPAAAFEALMDGVTSWDVPKGPIPSELLLIGEAAFPVMVNDQGQVLIAASSYGRGRLVVVSHEGYLLDAGLAPFLLNAVGWLCPSPGAAVGVHPSLASLANILQGSGVEAQIQPEPREPLGVYCINAYNDTVTAELIQFVKRGGGLLMGGQAWYWASQHGHDKVLSKFPGNQVTSVAGVYFTDTCGDRSRFKVSKKVPKIPLQVRGRNLEKSWLAKLGADGAGFLQIPAEGVPAYASLHRLLRKMLRLSGLPAVSREKPVASDSYEAALLCLATELAHSGTDCSQLAQGLGTWSCSSSSYPSEHAVTVEIDGNNPGSGDSWVSTGLYLPNGQNAEVSLSEAAVFAGLKVQIGCHTDDLTSASKLSRAPVVTHQCCMDRTKRSVSCLWGGLLYVIVPKGSKLGPVSVTIKRAVPAPYYRLGKTSLEEWKRHIQESTAPWGELATDNIILTVPTADLQALEDPESLLHLWDEMMQAIARLAAQPFPFLRPERIVADVQISAGWMHSGYPIMCHLQSVKELISEMGMRSRGLWGAIHELGHNQQRHGWEFPPHTTEATCNLWSVYVHETVLNIPRAQAHPALSPPEREKRIKTHLGKGAPLNDWNVWTALETYLKLQEAFGWEPFTQLFAEYQTLSNIPKDNTGKMNLWVKKFSERVQKNLAPFFEAWGWPVQKEVAASLACLPEWQENPMQMYIQTED